MSKTRSIVTSFFVFGFAIGISGCNGGTPIGVNLDFVKTNHGYVNSGGYRAGSFFRWDREEATLVYLGDIPGFEKPNFSRVSDRIASYEAGLEIGAQLNAYEKIAVNAEIAKRSSFTIKSSYRYAFNNVITKISKYINEDLSQGGSIDKEWKLKEAIDEGKYYYILIRDVTYGDDLQLSVDGQVKQSASFPVKVANAKYDVKISGKGFSSIKGSGVEALFSVYVLKPSYKIGDTTNYNFDVEAGLRLDQALPKLFRNVGNRS